MRIEAGTMLLKMSLKNFKSFKNAITLDLVSSTKVRALPSHVVRFGEMKVLRNAVIYGANASGISPGTTPQRYSSKEISFTIQIPFSFPDRRKLPRYPADCAFPEASVT